MIADWETNCVVLSALLKHRHPVLFKQLRQTLISHLVHVRLLRNVKDIWAKDYCPVQVRPGKFVKFRYDPDYLREEPRLRTGDEVVKSLHGFGYCPRSSVILDGGNVVASQTKAIVTNKVYKENPGWGRADLRWQLQRLLQVDQLIVIPREPYDPIGHADAMVRFVDESTVLVNDYSRVDPRFGERLVETLHRHDLEIEQLPYYLERRSEAGIPSAVGTFMNFLRTRHVLVAPVYGSGTDDQALRKLEAVFRGLSIIPLPCTNLAREGGVLNCVGATYRMQPSKV